MAQSYVEYNGNGSQTQFDYDKGYISKSHVTATVGGTPTSFVWVNATRIEFATPPPSGTNNVRIERATPRAPLVLTDFGDGTGLPSVDLDRVLQQSMYSIQEADDGVLNTLGLDLDDDKWDAESKVIKSVANGSAANDAVNKGQLDAVAILSGNVPTPANPADDNKVLKASGGSFSWASFVISMISDAAAFMKTFLGSVDTATALTNLGVNSTYAQDLGSASTKDVDEVLVPSQNLVTKSNQVDQWTADGITVSTNAAADPVWSLTEADKMIEDGSTGEHGAKQSFTAVNATQYHASVYADAVENSYVRFRLSNTAFAAAVYVVVNLSDGTVEATSGSPDSYEVEDIGSGWYRISLVATAQAGGTADVEVLMQDDSTTVSYTGDSASGMNVWGLQVVEGGTKPVQIESDGHIIGDPTYVPASGVIPAIPGSIGQRFRTKSASFTITDAEHGTVFIVDASGGNRVVTLPSYASLPVGFAVTISVAADDTWAPETDGTAGEYVTVDGSGSETLDGETSINLFPRQWMTLRYDGTAWTTESNPYMDIQAFTSSGTWNRPGWLSAYDEVDVILHGAGGGGNRVSTYNGGGAGGGACTWWKLLGNMVSAASYPITIGAGGTGGTTGSAGGASNFASVLYAYGGGGAGPGASNDTAGAGGGGRAVGGSNGIGTPAKGGKGYWANQTGGGDGTDGVADAGGNGGGNPASAAKGGDGLFGGGGGGDGGTVVTCGPGGNSFYGGGGGGGSANGAPRPAGGTSYLFGGNGGSGGIGGDINGGAGSTPGGGGGHGYVGGLGGDGADGQCIVICRRRA